MALQSGGIGPLLFKSASPQVPYVYHAKSNNTALASVINSTLPTRLFNHAFALDAYLGLAEETFVQPALANTRELSI